MTDLFERINTVNNILTYTEAEIPNADSVKKLDAVYKLLKRTRILLDTIENDIGNKIEELNNG